MKKIKAGIYATICLAVVSFTACKKTGNAPSTNPKLTFQLKADNAAVTLATTPATKTGLVTNSSTASIAGLTWTAGIANISKFKLEAKKNGIETEITSKNLTNVDLFALSPTIANATLDTGTYKEIEIRVVLEHSADTTAIPLKLTGTFTNSSGKVIPIKFELNDDVTIKAEAENIVVSSTLDFAALVHLHLNKLETGVLASDLEAATLTNGTIVISSSSNSVIYNKVLSNFTSCGESEMHHHQHEEGSNK